MAVEAARVETINNLAKKLVSQGHAGSADITQRQQALIERWNRLQDRASERRQRLAEACEMHAFDRDCKDVFDLINEKVSHPLVKVKLSNARDISRGRAGYCKWFTRIQNGTKPLINNQTSNIYLDATEKRPKLWSKPDKIETDYRIHNSIAVVLN